MPYFQAFGRGDHQVQMNLSDPRGPQQEGTLLKKTVCPKLSLQASVDPRIGAPNGRSLSWLQCLLLLAAHNGMVFTSRVTLPEAYSQRTSLIPPRNTLLPR
ncbi:hypothetical protein TNCV_1898441 [Trichonephila clavipes]|uniref:Uncharacterized protein n=1 Tax=Trichonephila clavipes TaxID=2585209 RepID=A0A8X7BK72_TRICX|nr:hypothetical protein TNCV_1898441 [Trichonephila clavipes]